MALTLELKFFDFGTRSTQDLGLVEPSNVAVFCDVSNADRPSVLAIASLVQIVRTTYGEVHASDNPAYLSEIPSGSLTDDTLIDKIDLGQEWFREVVSTEHERGLLIALPVLRDEFDISELC